MFFVKCVCVWGLRVHPSPSPPPPSTPPSLHLSHLFPHKDSIEGLLLMFDHAGERNANGAETERVRSKQEKENFVRTQSYQYLTSLFDCLPWGMNLNTQSTAEVTNWATGWRETARTRFVLRAPIICPIFFFLLISMISCRSDSLSEHYISRHLSQSDLWQ